MDSCSILCCTLCGVWIKQGRQACQEWLSRARAAISYRSTGSPSVTGVGFLREYDSCLLVCDDVHADLHNPFVNRDDEGRCFVFHDKCWLLLASKVGLEVNHDNLKSCTCTCISDSCLDRGVGRLLFYMLRTVEVRDKMHEGSHHDYGGASRFFRPDNPRKFPLSHKPTDDVVTSIPRELTYLLEDPFQLKGIFNGLDGESVEWKQSALNPEARPQWKWCLTGGKPGDRDLFSKLPDDLIHQVLTLLPSKDIRRACRASGAISKVSTRDQLPQSFWETRFMPGAEMDFIAPIVPYISSDCDGEQPPDWRQIYLDAERAVQNPDYLEFMGIKNRKRIWEVLGYFTDAIIPVVSHYTDGTLPWLQIRRSHPPVEYKIGYSAGPSQVYPRLASNSIDAMQAQSGLTGLMGEQFILWPCDPVTEPLRLGVSRLKLDARWYICGIRVRPAYGSSLPSSRGSTTGKMTVGLVNEAEEVDTVLEKGDRLLGVDVLHSSSAIIGMDFKICLKRKGKKNHNIGNDKSLGESRNFTVGWDKNAEDSYCVVDHHWLEPAKGQTIVGFNVGLDPFRFHTFALILKSNRQEVRKLTPKYTDGANESHARAQG